MVFAPRYPETYIRHCFRAPAWVTIPLATTIVPTKSFRLNATRELCVQMVARDKENDDQHSTWTGKNNETQIGMQKLLRITLATNSSNIFLTTKTFFYQVCPSASTRLIRNDKNNKLFFRASFRINRGKRKENVTKKTNYESNSQRIKEQQLNGYQL